jgi:hypothetical protein
LQAGGSTYRDRINAGGAKYNEWITSAHFVWTRETPEIIAEFANVQHENLTVAAPITNSQAYYVQAAYRLPVNDKRWKPYYRFDYIHVPDSDTVFQLHPESGRLHGRMRYDITNFAAIKPEYRNQRVVAKPDTRQQRISTDQFRVLRHRDIQEDEPSETSPLIVVLLALLPLVMHAARQPTSQLSSAAKCRSIIFRSQSCANCRWATANSGLQTFESPFSFALPWHTNATWF